MSQAQAESEPVTAVPLLALKGQYALLRSEIETVIQEVCDSQYFILGPRVEALEGKIAAYSNAAYGVGTSSGTDALLMALEIGAGDEVITTHFHSVVGGNFRLDALQAAILSVKLKYLDLWSAERQQNAKYYDERFAELGPMLKTPGVWDGCRHIYNQYTIRVPDRNGLKQYLTDKNIGCEIYYPVPLHRQECFEELGYWEGDLPESVAAANAVLSLPIYPELSTTQQDYVADAVCEFLNR